MSLGERFFGGAVRRPIAIFVFFVTLLVVGAIAYVRIPLEMMPQGLRGNGLQVFVQNPGASAEENEQKVARVLEGEIRTLSSIADVYSWSREDECSIEVIYERGTEMRLAKAELRDRIERARPLLPDTVDRVHVWSWNDGDLPLTWFALLHEGESERTDYLVETVVQRRLEAVDGVSRVQVWGMLDDSVRILLDEQEVKAAQLDIGELIRRLRQDNFTEPLGEVQDGGQRVLLRSDMRFRSLEEIASFPIGRGLVLSDVARVEQVKSVRDRLSRIDGRDAYFGEIGKESAANVVETARAVRNTLREIEEDPALEGRFRFLVLFSQGDFIESSLSQLRDTALWGGVLAAVILFLFLRRVRATLCVALSIPVSALLALAWEYFSGGSFNVLTMTGITLAIGMLVDNSVVVIENIARCSAEGRPPREAAAEGVRDVGLAVSLATLTTVVVFLPLIFMAGDPMLRLMFGALGFPLCLALLFSLMVALVFLPVATARILGPRPRIAIAAARALTPVASAPARLLGLLVLLATRAAAIAIALLHRIERAALTLLAPLRWPLALAFVGLALWRTREWAASSALLAPMKRFGASPLSPATGPALWILAGLLGAALALFGLPRWRARPARPPLVDTQRGDRPTSLVELAIASNGRLSAWTVEHRVFACFLAFAAFLSVLIPRANLRMTSFGEDENNARIDVRVRLEDNFTLAEASRELERYEKVLAEHEPELGFDHVSVRFDRRGGRVSLYWDESQPPGEIGRVRRRMREILPAFPGHELIYFDEEQIDTKSRAIATFQLEGPDHEVLARLGREAIARLSQVPGLSGVSSPLENAPERVHVAIDGDQAWQLGVTADVALQNIAWALRGAPLPRFQESSRELPFYIEYDAEETAGLATLRELDVFSVGGIVPLASFARLEFRRGPTSILRHNGKTTFTIQARVDDVNRQKELSDAGYAALREMELPRGYSVGEASLVSLRQEEEMAELMKALLLSVVLVFLLMGILFESVLLPFSVLFTIPFAITGALWTLWLTGTVMDSVGWIGLIILVGVVVNNGIVLIDRIHRLRLEGMERSAAVIEGGKSRVRPILMTAMTTIFGLLPMALAAPPSEGIDYRALATCVAGGLAFSTFFTLWVVPLAYTLFDDLGHALRSRASWHLRPRGITGSAELPVKARS